MITFIMRLLTKQERKIITWFEKKKIRVFGINSSELFNAIDNNEHVPQGF